MDNEEGYEDGGAEDEEEAEMTDGSDTEEEEDGDYQPGDQISGAEEEDEDVAEEDRMVGRQKYLDGLIVSGVYTLHFSCNGCTMMSQVHGYIGVLTGVRGYDFSVHFYDWILYDVSGEPLC